MQNLVSLDWPTLFATYGAVLLAVAAVMALCVISLPFSLIGLRRRLDLLAAQNAELLRQLSEQRTAQPTKNTGLPSPAAPGAEAARPQVSPPPILRADVTLRQNRQGRD